MPENIELQIVTSTDASFKTEIKDIYIPAYLGEAGILENHLPYISLLNFGEISYTDLEGKRHYLIVHEGIIEVLSNKIVIISDLIEKGEELEKSEVEAKLNEVTNRIKSSLRGEITAEELEDALQEEKKLKIKFEITKKINA